MPAVRPLTSALVLSLSLLSAAPLVHAVGGAEQPRVIGGQVATVNPGLAAFGKESGRLSCTSTLISPEWILAAKHCFLSEESRPFVRVGSLKLASGGQERKGVAVKFAPAADLALLKIDQPVTDVTPVKIADVAPKKGDALMTWGWGRTAQQSEEPSPDLKTCPSTVVSPSMDGKGGQAWNLRGQGCAQWKGDSGGPALNAAGQLVGVASTANGDLANPGANYTSVVVYRAWIKDVAGV